MDGVGTSCDGAVGLIRLERPEKRNALSTEILTGLADALAQFDLDPEIRCIVVAGSERVFASGADLRSLSELSTAEVYAGGRVRQWDRIRSVRTPSVAAVSGHCLGGGFELAMLMDIIIASETARFGLPETSLGLIPGAGGTQALTNAVGKSKAMEVILAGRLLTAAEADRFGVVSRVVGPDRWLQESLAVAATVAARPPTALGLAKEAVLAGIEFGSGTGRGFERRAFAIAFGTPDAQDAIAAFLEKRDSAERR